MFNIFIILAPSLFFTKSDLYEPNTKFSKKYGTYIKAIPDGFFLSNQFRKENIIHFCTSYNKKSYTVTFKGNKLKYLGPSFFSAAHLLLRAKNHLHNPYTKKGKLTPGLSIEPLDFKELLERYSNKNQFQVISSKETLSAEMVSKNNNLFIFGKRNNLSLESISFGQLDIDEQVILTNFLIDKG